MTEQEYVLMCEGHKLKETNHLKLIRLQSWVVYCGYADPKKSPKSMQAWWPIEGDEEQVKPRKITKSFLKKLVELDKRVRNAKRVEYGRS